ncbi:hypothetical protein RJZ56_007305 [Blastomyces dermatitidis]|uniref:Gamma-glutamylcyclotransferase AIG2-like domain-containing protein n=3 Tax=Blastomyces TaxID=229219 RepID=A0A179UJW5_BLAGS|nr:uncharacterized protein BDBG_04247 [Blastomyces gilchristii SLH14081]XP_045272690.1 uncharacterized protein BDCG_08066 [Blastomyces dermatitidis ER-3]EEQ84797.1 hypothetical protein BDCG_08066 [Blastomyces dermatitidis ER-3]EGE84610.1 hypothetical protein BDDG_07555 [Blastomyces dermatitidis ATCC 18188]OAT08284.1 hypothetical protein BDBG_04247 [Blastomyces gilchristii SLH14081]
MSGEEKENDSSKPAGLITYHAEDLSTRSVCYAPADWYLADWQNDGPKKGWYFVYGVVADEYKLAAVIGDEETPVLHRAKVLGYKLMLWEAHLALTDGCSTAEVQGKAFYVESPLHARRLRGYMVEVLKVEPCRIHLEDADEGVVDGYAFIWDGPMNGLRSIPAN